MINVSNGQDAPLIGHFGFCTQDHTAQQAATQQRAVANNRLTFLIIPNNYQTIKIVIGRRVVSLCRVLCAGLCEFSAVKNRLEGGFRKIWEDRSGISRFVKVIPAFLIITHSSNWPRLYPSLSDGISTRSKEVARSRKK